MNNRLKCFVYERKELIMLFHLYNKRCNNRGYECQNMSITNRMQVSYVILENAILEFKSASRILVIFCRNRIHKSSLLFNNYHVM